VDNIAADLPAEAYKILDRQKVKVYKTAGLVEASDQAQAFDLEEAFAQDQAYKIAVGIDWPVDTAVVADMVNLNSLSIN
jgi:hypothetical protein